MKKLNTKTILALLSAILIVLVSVSLLSYSSASNDEKVSDNKPPKIKKTPESRLALNQGRAEHFFTLTRDPKTNKVPANIRAKELAFAEKADKTNFKSANNLVNIEYSEIGPYDVGGRTRALAIDRRNSDIILAGGVAGGIWKSINGGTSWTKQTDESDDIGVTDLVQHPTNQDTWYYTTGEFSSSNQDRSFDALFFGTGIYKSTNNGDDWEQVEATSDKDLTFNSEYDFISRIIINPATGSIFFASNDFAIYRTTDDFASTELILGSQAGNQYSTIEITANGTLIGVLSDPNTSGDPTGVFVSSNDGDDWTDITPEDFPSSHNRSVVGISDSNPDRFYVFSSTNGFASGLRLFHFNIANLQNVSTSDRSSGIPNFGPPVGDLNPQGSYNLVCKVHPTNPEAVFLGATNLYRSFDGFDSEPITSNEDRYWIGGYAISNNVAQYSGHHPDQHNIVFDPNNPNRAFSSHDGGISVTQNILAEPVVWQNKDKGYNVTQFYAVSIHPDAGDNRVVGGTQDNGSPYFLYNTELSTGISNDISSGDGSYNHLAKDYAIVSAQNGHLLRWNYTAAKSVTTFSYMSPKDANNQLFIHPFAVNPSNDEEMFYPSRNFFWRHSSVASMEANQTDVNGIEEGWEKLLTLNTGSGFSPSISTLAYSTNNPSNRLYYAGSSSSKVPVLFRLDDSSADDGEVDISIPFAESGSYIHGIAVNPFNGDEVIAVASNYNVESVYHSNDAGANWTAVGGNIEGESGPSVRTAAIGRTGNGDPVYFIGTSTGLYATMSLSGASTVWEKQSPQLIGNSIVENLDYRYSDGTLAIGTHGRGIFLGEISQLVSNEWASGTEVPSSFSLDQNYPNPFNPSTTINFSIPSNSTVTLTIYDISGNKVASLFENKSLSTGSYTQNFDASSLASGTYLYRLEAIPVNGGTGFVESKTMTLIK